MLTRVRKISAKKYGLYIHNDHALNGTDNTRLRVIDKYIDKYDSNMVKVFAENVSPDHVFEKGGTYSMFESTLTNHYYLALEEGSVWGLGDITTIRLLEDKKEIRGEVIEAAPNNFLRHTVGSKLHISPWNFVAAYELEKIEDMKIEPGDIFEWRESADEEWPCNTFLRIEAYNDIGIANVLVLEDPTENFGYSGYEFASWSSRFENDALFRRVIQVPVEDLGTRQI